MKAKPVTCLAAVFGLLAIAMPLAAHHGGVAYETGKRITLKGTIAGFDWTNPHSQVHLDVTDDKGNVAHWNFETQPPSILMHAGWHRDSLKPGDQVTLVAVPAKNGSTIGLLQKVTLADGEELTPTEK